MGDAELPPRRLRAVLAARQRDDGGCCAAVPQRGRRARIDRRFAYRERARIIHRARLETMQIAGNTRKELVDAALEQARGRLAGFRTDPRYPEVLRNLLQQALSELNGSGGKSLEAASACLEADPRDRPLLDALLEELDLNLAVGYSIQCWGGLIARSENGRVAVINTLEARLERAIPYLRSHLAALFEDESVRPVMNGSLQFPRTKESG